MGISRDRIRDRQPGGARTGRAPGYGGRTGRALVSEAAPGRARGGSLTDELDAVIGRTHALAVAGDGLEIATVLGQLEHVFRRYHALMWRRLSGRRGRSRRMALAFFGRCLRAHEAALIAVRAEGSPGWGDVPERIDGSIRLYRAAIRAILAGDDLAAILTLERDGGSRIM
jgi:hypothetical protein